MSVDTQLDYVKGGPGEGGRGGGNECGDQVRGGVRGRGNECQLDYVKGGPGEGGRGGERVMSVDT